MNLSRQATPSRGMKSDQNYPSALEQRLIIYENQKKLKRSLWWGFINICLLGLVIYDIQCTCPINVISFILFLEYVLSVIFVLNIAYHTIRYINISLNIAPIVVSPKPSQFQVIKDYDQTFAVLDDSHSPIMSRSFDSTPNASFSKTPMNMSALSWKSNATPGGSPPGVQSSFSCVRTLPQYSLYEHNPRHASSLNVMHHDSSGGEFIADEQSLTNYLKGYQSYEKATNATNPAEPPASALSSFWSHPAAKSSAELPSFLKKCQYQLSPISAGSSSSSPSGKSDDNGSPTSTQLQGMEMWRHLNVDSATLTQWNANIRMWISQTIVERLVKEIEMIDEGLQKHGMSDVRIGAVGLERLRKTAQMTPVVQYIPTLSTLIPFLELSTNQEYLVKRIRDLAKGGCMSDFKWNRGSSFNGKEWNDFLPTDSAIIMHLFATYMDTQLQALPNDPDIKPFSGNHFIRVMDKMPDLDDKILAIHQVSEKPPHYRVIVGKQIYEVSKGYNNLFHSLLLFLYQANIKEHGMLGRINLGRSGLNILWVIGS